METWTSILNWLKHHKDAITSGTAMLQAIAVIFAVFFAVNEFIVKDRSAESSRLNNSYDLRKRFEDLPIKAFDFSFLTTEELHSINNNEKNITEDTFYKTQKYLLGAFIDIFACINATQCDVNLTKELFCEPAKITSESIRVVYFENGYKDEHIQNMLPVEPLYKFVSMCSPSTPDVRAGVQPKWWSEYLKWREKVPASDTLRLHGPREPNKAFKRDAEKASRPLT